MEFLPAGKRYSKNPDIPKVSQDNAAVLLKESVSFGIVLCSKERNESCLVIGCAICDVAAAIPLKPQRFYG
jgi:hypothetical protein